MKTLQITTAALATLMLSTSMSTAGPEVVDGPGVDTACFAPWDADTKFFQWEAQEGPYRIAIVNGFVGKQQQLIRYPLIQR